MNSTQKILLSGILGIAAGATAGILFAPNAGKKTRKKIAKSAEDIKDSMHEFAEASKEAIVDMARNGQEKAKA